MTLSDILSQECNRREFIKKLGIGATALALNLNPVSSATSSKNNHDKKQKYNVLKFYLDPNLAPNIEFAKKVLPKYVEDMNYILQKNTNLKLIFNPKTDIIYTSIQPYSNNCPGKLPTKNFEIWAHAILSDKNHSYKGKRTFDKSGAAVLGNLKWREIYDPDKLENNPYKLRDYWTQIDHMLHELAHIFEAGVSEYYNLIMVDDTTGIEPILNIRLSNPNDSYWKNKPDYKTDPLLGNIMGLISTPIKNRAKTRKELLKKVQYSNLTAALISSESRGKLKSTTPSLKNMKLRTIDKNNSQPLPDTSIKIFGIRSFPPYESRLLVNKPTDSSGELIFDWGDTKPFSNYQHLRLIKASKPGHEPQAKYISIFDLQEAKILHNQDVFSVEIQL